MTITIHQPNFMPWYPFFEKIQQADIFVLLGHCQFEKNGFQNRFSIHLDDCSLHMLQMLQAHSTYVEIVC